MRVLAIDSSGLTATVAIVEDDRDRLQDFGSDLQQQKVWGLR